MRSSTVTAVTTCGSVTGDRSDHMWLRHRYHIQTSDFVAFHSLQHLPCRCFTPPVLMKREPDVSPTIFSSVIYYNTRAVEDTVVSDDMNTSHSSSCQCTHLSMYALDVGTRDALT